VAFSDGLFWLKQTASTQRVRRRYWEEGRCGGWLLLELDEGRGCTAGFALRLAGRDVNFWFDAVACMPSRCHSASTGWIGQCAEDRPWEKRVSGRRKKPRNILEETQLPLFCLTTLNAAPWPMRTGETLPMPARPFLRPQHLTRRLSHVTVNINHKR